MRNVVSAVLAYPSTSGGGCLLTQCDRTTLFLGGCVLMTIPISEDTLLPSHTVRNVVPAVLAYSSTSGGGCLLTQCDRTTLLLGHCVMCVVSCSR